MTHKYLFSFLFFLLFLNIKAQDSTSYYLVYFKDKPQAKVQILTPQNFLSEKALARRKKYNVAITEADAPLEESYIKQIANLQNIAIHNKSKWLNAVEIKSNANVDLKTLKALNFVNKIEFLGRIKNIEQAKPFTEVQSDVDVFIYPKFEQNDYKNSFNQNNLINIILLHQKYILANNIYIGVLDAGFNNACKINGLEQLSVNTITKDFVTHDNSVWEDDQHGANCLAFMATYALKYIGTAPFAQYLLCRTEDAATEYPTEEVNWLAAAEFADSCGVDMIVSSLGYTQFDDKKLGHTHDDLDGKTSIIAQAANLAYSKGIMVITSAGNEGDDTWHKIGTPADATGVISVGATDNIGIHAPFSSYGYSADRRIKPDFVSMGYKAIVASPKGYYEGNGTSYATPILAGAVACLMQAYPNAPLLDIKKALQLSASHAQMPDTAYGYGLPDMALAAHILGNVLNKDSTKDLMYEPPANNYWQQQTIHFKSTTTQTVEIKIVGTRKRKNKEKQLFEDKINLKSGEWVHNYSIHQIIQKQKKVGKRKKLSKLAVIITTQTATYNRILTL